MQNDSGSDGKREPEAKRAPDSARAGGATGRKAGDDHRKTPDNALSQAETGVKVAAKGGELEKQHKQLKDQQEALQRRVAGANEVSRQLDEKQKRLAKEESDLVRRKNELTARELDASNNFLRQNREALAPYEARAEVLRKMIVQLEQSLPQQRSEAEQELTQWKQREMSVFQKNLATERQLMETDLSARRGALDRETESFSRERIAQLASIEQQRGQLLLQIEARFEQMAREHTAELEKTLAARQQELKDRFAEAELNTELAAEKSRLTERDREELKREKDEAIEEHKRQVATTLQQAQREAGSLRTERDLFSRRVQELEQERLAFKDRRTDEVLRDLQTLEEEAEHLRQELARRATDREMLRAKGLETQLEQERVHRQELDSELAKAQQELARRRLASIQLEQLRDEREDLQANLAVLRTIVADKHKEYEAMLDKVRSASDTTRIKPGTIEYEKRAGDLKQWPFTTLESGGFPANEKVWLQRLEKAIEGAGLTYPPRLLSAFHTCLKIAEWSPLTVLAGVSGTGKSELPRVYARYGGFYFHPVAVQPNWDSPQDVFGFFNYLDNRFNARPLLRGMAQSQEPPAKGGFNHQIMLVLLDEMNLARIELYLSELLSKWELRRGQGEAKLEFDLGANCDKFEVPLGRNVIFAGTINEDESTQSLSDKVLDRGNLLYFPRPKEFRSRATLALKPQQAPTLAAPMPVAAWNGWLRPPVLLDKVKEQRQTYQDSLERINGYLAAVERGVGHRVWQAIEVYMANHPDVIAAIESQNEKEQPIALRRAFEDQLVQRLIPKLRGIEVDGAARKECLDPIAAEIAAHAGGLTNDFQAALESGRRTFFWRQSDYLYKTD
jgi:hypothetical protein